MKIGKCVDVNQKNLEITLKMMGKYLEKSWNFVSPEMWEPYWVGEAGFPLGLENLENLEKWEGIFQSGKSQGILNRLEKSGKITQNTGKLR